MKEKEKKNAYDEKLKYHFKCLYSYVRRATPLSPTIDSMKRSGPTVLQERVMFVM